MNKIRKWDFKINLFYVVSIFYFLLDNFFYLIKYSTKFQNCLWLSHSFFFFNPKKKINNDGME